MRIPVLGLHITTDKNMNKFDDACNKLWTGNQVISSYISENGDDLDGDFLQLLSRLDNVIRSVVEFSRI